MSQRIRFTSARQVLEAFPTMREDIETEPGDEAPLDFVRRLLDPGKRYESIVFLAYLLPRREAVWWACQCVAAANAVHDAEALQAAEAWVRDPTEEKQRAALAIGWARDARRASTWLALAAGQSGGNIAAHEGAKVAPPPQATAVAVKAAVILAVARSPAQRLEWLRACVEAGVRFAEGGDAKVIAPVSTGK